MNAGSRLFLLSASVVLVAARRGPPSVAFRDAACPSAFAPRSCAGGTASTCHEAFVTGGPAAGCTTGHGASAVHFVPEDGGSDGGTSRSWSFATRPLGRAFYSTYPETTGSVRVTTDGAGARGSVAGASDEAHLRLSARGTARRLLVLRWFTGGFPTGAAGRISLARAGHTVFSAGSGAGPPATRSKVIPVRWRGDLDLTVSAYVTGPRDQPVPSADLLWHLTVLPLGGDADHDGVANAHDPEPLDPTIPRRRAPRKRPSVLVLGLDGGGWDVLRPLMNAGYLPTIGQVVRGGVSAPLDETPAESSPSLCCYCPPIWSSILTGQPLSVHKMADIPSEPWDRPAPSVSSVLTKHGGTTTHVSYRNTFPPEPGSTFNFTEPGLDVAATELFRTHGFSSDARGEFMNRMQLSWPPLLFETMNLLPPSGPPGPQAWEPLARDRVGATALTRLAARERTDLTMWILHSVDKTEHVTWTEVQPSAGAAVDDATLLDQAATWTGPVTGPVWVFGNVASQTLEADLHLRELLAVATYDYVMLLSDHSMTFNTNYPHPPLSGVHTLAPAYHGIFALQGPGVVAGQTLGTISVLDIAPTLAYLLRLPVAADLPGRVVTEAFTREHLSAHRIRTVPRW